MMFKHRFVKYVIIALCIVCVLSLAGCAPGGNQFEKVADADGNTANFWLGIWHGFIAPITFIVSLFSDSVNVYEVYNNGNWYNFGFVLGACCSIFGGARSSKRSSKKNYRKE